MGAPLSYIGHLTSELANATRRVDEHSARLRARVASARKRTTSSSCSTHPPNNRTALVTSPVNRVQVIDFKGANSVSSLAVIIGMPSHLLEEVVTDDRQSRFYREHRIPKKRPTPGEAFRSIWEAESFSLLAAHKQLSRKFEGFARKESDYPSDYAHGYIRGRSTLTNARIHAGAKNCLNADLRNFFGSITTGRIEQLFLSLGMHAEGAQLLARFVTIDGLLPLGLHTSPLISNLVCTDLDRRLFALSQRYGSSYSRYADDITFSSNGVLPPKIEIQSCVEEEGFALSPTKFRVTKLGQAHYVTGLSISDSNPRIPRRLKRQIRQELYYAHKFGLKSHLGRKGDSTISSGGHRIDGSIRYIASVEKEIGSRLRMQWREVLERDGVKPVFVPRHSRSPWSATFLIDESEVVAANGKRVLILGCAVIEDIGSSDEAVDQLVQRHLKDPYTSGDKGKLARKGLHFTDVSQEIRTDYIKVLSELPFTAYLAYAEMTDGADYRQLYMQLVSKLLPHRLIYADRANVAIIAEQNSQIDCAELEQYVQSLYSQLVSSRSRRPLSCPGFRIGRKLEDPSLSAIDFILGVFGQYATLNICANENNQEARSARETAIKRFERLRDKIRVIISQPTAETFFSKKPFLPWSNGDPSTSQEESCQAATPMNGAQQAP